MSQVERELSLLETVRRYEGWERGGESYAGRHMADDLFRKAVTTHFNEKSGSDTEKDFETALANFRTHVANLISKKGRGAPTTFGKSWKTLGLDDDDIAWLFYLALHQLIEAILPAVQDEDIQNAMAATDDETDDEPDEEDSPSEENTDDASPQEQLDDDLDNDESVKDYLDSLSSQQKLYSDLWQEIAIRLALNKAPDRAGAPSAMDQILYDFEQERAIDPKQGMEFSAIIVALVNLSLGGRWFTLQKGGKSGTNRIVPTKVFLRQVKTLSEMHLTLHHHAPLIEPPIAWGARGIDQGGFHRLHLPFFKFHRKNLKIRDFLPTVNQRDWYDAEVFPAVNALQKTAWRINRRLWKVVGLLFEQAGVQIPDVPDATVFATGGSSIAAQLEATDEKQSSRNILLERAAELRALTAKVRRERLEALTTEQRRDLGEWLEKTFYARKGRHADGPGARLARRVAVSTAVDAAARERIYFAYQADTRGRLYPVAGNLHPQNEELVRALLEFADPKPLSVEGVRHLAIHGSQQVDGAQILTDLGVAGQRPPTLDERAQWVEEQSEAIVASAEDPLANNWWRKVAKSPFMFLAFCFAWRDFKDGNKECRLPVYVDGTCNGVQHIATLIRDRELAEATNVIPGKCQRDIYGEIADIVRDRLFSQPAAFSSARGTVQLAEKERNDCITFLKQGFLTLDRALGKRVVMIIPYGAGLGTYQDEIGKALVERFLPKSTRKLTFIEPAIWILKHVPNIMDEVANWKDWAPLPDTQMSAARQASARKLDLYKKKRTAVARWLRRKCARHIAEHFHVALQEEYPSIEKFKRRLSASIKPALSKKIPIMWVSPSGLPVLQDSFKEVGSKHDNKSLEKKLGNRIRFRFRTVTNDVFEKGQAMALLPNFIHSHDAAHLVKTINLACMKGVTTFGAIHDGFATHASDMAALSTCIREAFLEVYPPGVDRLAQFERWCAILAGEVDTSDSVDSFTDAEKALLGLARTWTVVGEAPASKKAGGARRKKAESPAKTTLIEGDDWISEVVDSTYFFS